MQIAIRALMLAALFCTSFVHAATLLPAVQISIDGKTMDLPRAEIVDEKGVLSWTFPPGFLLGDGSVRVDSLQAQFKEDPFLTYALAVTNISASPVTFTFIFSTPYVGGPYNLLKSSHQSGVTDGGEFPDGAVTVTPTPKAFVHVPSVDGTDIAAASLGVGCSLTGAPGFSAACDASGPPVFAAVSSGATGTLGVMVSFKLSAFDSATMSGRVDLLNNPVPEPSTLALIGGGLIAVGLRVRRRR